MRNVYNEQLRMLHQNMTEMGAQCESAVSLAVQAVTLGSEELAARVFEVDAGIDKMERDIESLCLKLLLKQQPVASGKTGYGFDAYKEVYCDMMESGIVDPTKVTRSALENASSIASVLLTTESLVADKPQPAAAAAPAGEPGMPAGMY